MSKLLERRPAWLCEPRDVYSGVTLLTPQHPRATTPRRFKTPLWPPQATLLSAMLALEDQGALATTAIMSPFGGASPIARTNTARIAERVSFGKTATCIALVCASRCPRLFPQLVFPKSDPMPPGTAVLPRIEIRRPRVIASTLVVCATATLSQWEENLKRHAPALKYIVVDSVYALKRFHKVLEEDGVPDVDLVLLRAGTVSTSFKVEGEQICPQLHTNSKKSDKSRPITIAMRAVTAGYVWARLVVDDFDMIKLTWRDTFIPSVFTWLVSATQRKTVQSHARQISYETGTVGDFIRRAWARPLPEAAGDPVFQHGLCIKCQPSYVDDCVQSFRPVFRRIAVKAATATDILAAMGVGADVVEMAETGAIEAAAEQLGIRVSNMGDLLAKVLDKNVTLYRQATSYAVAIKKLKEGTAPAPPPGGQTTPDDVIAGLKETPPRIPEQAIWSPALMAEIDKLETVLKATQEKYGGRLERMRGNLRQGWCQGCTVPWDDSDDEGEHGEVRL